MFGHPFWHLVCVWKVLAYEVAASKVDLLELDFPVISPAGTHHPIPCIELVHQV